MAAVEPKYKFHVAVNEGRVYKFKLTLDNLPAEMWDFAQILRQNEQNHIGANWVMRIDYYEESDWWRLDDMKELPKMSNRPIELRLTFYDRSHVYVPTPSSTWAEFFQKK